MANDKDKTLEDIKAEEAIAALYGAVVLVIDQTMHQLESGSEMLITALRPIYMKKPEALAGLQKEAAQLSEKLVDASTNYSKVTIIITTISLAITLLKSLSEEISKGYKEVTAIAKKEGADEGTNPHN